MNVSKPSVHFRRKVLLMKSHHLDIHFRRIVDTLPSHFVELAIESEQEGFHFIRRFLNDWNDGANRFSHAGEALFIAEHDGQVIGVCGLNIDPYAGSPNVGRVRRLYVSTKFRRHGVGSKLLEKVVLTARDHFTHLHLLTRSQDAARFYAALGFVTCTDLPQCTHVLQLK